MLRGRRFISLRVEAIEAELDAGVERFEAEDVRYLILMVRRYERLTADAKLKAELAGGRFVRIGTGRHEHMVLGQRGDGR